MDLNLRQKKTIIKNIKTTIISPNEQLILLVMDPWNVLIHSTFTLKQIWRFQFQSYIQEFSPSSQLVAFGSTRGQLSVIKLGKQELVYHKKFGIDVDRNIIKYIKFQNESTLLAISFNYYSIYKVDLNGVTQPITLSCLLFSSLTFSYGDLNDIILFMKLKTECLTVLNMKNGRELFQSQYFPRLPQQIQLLDDKNLVLVNFMSYSELYYVDYKQKKFKQIECEIPQSSFDSCRSKLCRDYIITIAPNILPEFLTIQFNFLNNQKIIKKAIRISAFIQTVQLFQVGNQIYLAFLIQQMTNQKLILFKGSPK